MLVEVTFLLFEFPLQEVKSVRKQKGIFLPCAYFECDSSITTNLLYHFCIF